MKARNYQLGIVIAGAMALALQSCGPAYVTAIPNRPYETRTNSPYLGGVWIDGGWNYNDKSYYAGSWGQPHAGKTYYPGQWNKGRRGYIWRDGHWR